MAGGDLEKHTLRKARVEVTVPAVQGCCRSSPVPAGSLLLTLHGSRHTFLTLLTLTRRFLLELPLHFLAQHFKHFIRILNTLGTYYFW